ncbi:MAG: hypothetical protein RM347_000470 [Nostoc sp. ChiQUE02]|uniref:hypothetical protein n=1 Tax=Nostoc sp. ChiQUE02 TaxID=3075377 RepID=UPI002AD1E648|nr:hypothetical protein [Nostoc sp. ChiQUE02]MDZ8235218.1 hypothetical protein [Nostoc sp. ChiQUE02]
MARKLLELDTEDSGTIVVAVNSPNISVDRVSATGELPVKKVKASFDSVYCKKNSQNCQSFWIIIQLCQQPAKAPDFSLATAAKIQT